MNELHHRNVCFNKVENMLILFLYKLTNFKFPYSEKHIFPCPYIPYIPACICSPPTGANKASSRPFELASLLTSGVICKDMHTKSHSCSSCDFLPSTLFLLLWCKVMLKVKTACASSRASGRKKAACTVQTYTVCLII